MLEIKSLMVRYGHVVAVARLDLTVADGEFVVVTGSNGSGKSSMLRAVLGLVAATSGTIDLDGVRASDRRSWRERRRSVAYVPQRTAPGSFPLLVDELLEGPGGVSDGAAAATALGVQELRHRPVTTLSGGQLQRTYLARALGAIDRGASLFLADEPTSALDFDGQDEVAALLEGLSCTRLVVSHDAALVARADRVMEMAGGVLREVAR